MKWRFASAWWLLMIALILPACVTPPNTPASVSEVETAEINHQILAALKERRYADAMAATRRAPTTPAERDFALGMLALEGLADPQAAQRPTVSVTGALSLIETAALAGHAQAISTLASTFERGLRGGTGDSVIVAPDAALSECWHGAVDQPAATQRCVAMRRDGR